MDIDPLADVAPPRHAVESEDEEESSAYPTLGPGVPEPDVKINCNVQHATGLVIATGDAGCFWANGANLGDPVGNILFNGSEVGQIFTPSWTGAIILVSEFSTKIPTRGMHVYAETVLNTLKPSRIGLLDSYSAPEYINSEQPFGDPPVLCLSNQTSMMLPSVQPFSPPNLLQSTSSSFLSVLTIACVRQQDKVFHRFAAFFLPANNPLSHVPLNQIQEKRSTLSSSEWPTNTMCTIHKNLLAAAGEHIYSEWAKRDGNRIHHFARVIYDSKEEGMYI